MGAMALSDSVSGYKLNMDDTIILLSVLLRKLVLDFSLDGKKEAMGGGLVKSVPERIEMNMKSRISSNKFSYYSGLFFMVLLNRRLMP